MERTGETAAAAIWGTHGPTVVRLVEARHEQASIVPLGHVCPLTFSAAGLVFCAFGSAEQTAKIADKEMAQSRAAGRCSAPKRKAELDRLVALVRKQGFACVAIEGEGGMSAVSAPVFDSSGAKLQLALSVFGRVGRLNITPGGPVVKSMAEAARTPRCRAACPPGGQNQFLIFAKSSSGSTGAAKQVLHRLNRFRRRVFGLNNLTSGIKVTRVSYQYVRSARPLRSSSSMMCVIPCNERRDDPIERADAHEAADHDRRALRDQRHCYDGLESPRPPWLRARRTPS